MKWKIGSVILLILAGIYAFSIYSYKSTPKIALIEINGVISSSTETIRQIRIAEKDKSIKGIILHVNSPGGAVGASQAIYRAIEKIREKKPVVVSMENVAASGGYYVSAPANIIYANPGTITGSIGVIIQHVDATEILNKIGLKIENIKSGKHKDILYPNRKLTPEEKKLIEETILDVYDQFLDAIVKYRPIQKEELKKIADGRIFSGRQAKELKLVDKLGNIQDAIEEAKKISKAEKAIVIKLTKPKGFLQKLVEGKLGVSFDTYISSGIYYLLSF
ncbi:MAG: signal peptide peptidase SppA [Aquificae bacterium]|nr:signal peptide peptidase SppA [Aquificota bacterium]